MAGLTSLIPTRSATPADDSPGTRRDSVERSVRLLDRIRTPRGIGGRAPHHAGLVVGTLAAISLVSSVSVTFRHIIAIPRDWVDLYVISAPDTSFAWAFVLALLAVALSARKRVAWWLTALYLLLFAGTNALLLVPEIGREYDVTMAGRVSLVIGLCLDAAVLVFLAITYRQFYTRVRRGALLKALAVLAGGLLAATLVGWGLVEAFPRSLTADQRLAYAFNRVVTFSSVDKGTFDGNHTYTVINSLLGLLGALALILAAIVLFRSQRLAGLLTPADERLIRALIEAYNDDDSLAYFSTRRDKAVVFAPNAHAAITYRVEVGVCLASGDPIGDPRHWPDAIAEFLALCEQYGWHPAAMGASERGATAFSAAGMTALNIGDEAIVDTRTYSLAGPDMRGVRQAVTRCLRAGITVRIRRHGDLSDAEMAGVIARADAWRDTDEERGFAMALSRLGDRLDDDCLLVEAVADADTDAEKVVGMLSFVPWGRTGVSLDLMRRDRDSINGIVETMVTELAAGASNFNITRISLNFAAFREVFAYGEKIGAGPVMKGAHGVLTFASRFVQMESLYRSNDKYLPTWTPRFLCCEDARLILRAGVAAIVTEGFVTLPRFRRDTRAHVGTQCAIPSGLDADTVVAEIAEDAQTRSEGVRRPEQVRVRLDKLSAMSAAGIEAYPSARVPSHAVAEALTETEGTDVRIAGRVLRLRDFGKVVFAEVRDWTGTAQVVLDAAALDGQTTSEAGDFARTVDLGDLVEVSGTMGRSRSGEWSVLASDWRMIGKCLHPLPDKWSGLTDPEARVRQRYVDLAIDPRAGDRLRTRSLAVKSMRDFLSERGFLEVETPILQRIHGGANAEPFRTHINAYDLDLYLRIAPELYLKRLCVGGVERVFEIGRNFRNEGVDFSHNPEFTSLEAYQAHGDYDTMLHLTRELIQNAATAAHGSPVVMRPGPDGPVPVDISGEWPVTTVHAAVSEAAGEKIDPTTGIEQLRTICDRLAIVCRPEWDAGQIVLELYEHLVEDRTTMPTFYKDFPTSVSPLTRSDPDSPGVAQRWDLVAWGVELGTAYSELTDPVEQRSRLTAQSQRAAGGDAEAMELDEDFLTALEYAMPPTGGLGIGVDRVIMLITGQSIRESLAFPLAKPR
ncbi:bifunctional lysylphosphatidylglycerol synthetase/lysine--tRNA ligase LysX [Williamsia phyllosphaerae]|uniref:Lysine--tRNA ligase n=1 Tax=Williamsia phyllosphaerae TaxID=885042 RepID=A0ABQ1UC80_9NOCA|nr:bifunctional lysylphosphatidylglycerol synthetase/lysine--tRNA ligase LysX [Williamsia phyllosphaerae]GGF15611.1 lysylphosphatidylglycerol biosynthesis bifunctional protein LysX [Williamsia phyllosphaerae]